jgi:ParB-like chromosome segregation protein Spo0J
MSKDEKMANPVRAILNESYQRARDNLAIGKASRRKYEFHPLAELFPPLGDADLRELAEDIRAHGLREGIDLYDDRIIDGRNRYLACKLAKIVPRYKELRVSSDDEALAHVISKNLKRRHLDESQRAMVAAKIATMRQGSRTDLASNEARSQADAADLLNVSRSAVQRATTVKREGVPEVVEAVEKGDLSVSAAAVIAKQPPSDQRRVSAMPKAERKAAVREMRRSSRTTAQSSSGATAVRLVPWDQAANKVALAEADWSLSELRELRDAIDEILSTPVIH